MKLLYASFLVLMFVTADAQSVTPAQAKSFIGKDVQVCGLITSAQFMSQMDGHPTFLGFGNPFPNQTFSAVILENDLVTFPGNPVDLKGLNVCVKGKVELYAGKPCIMITNPAQIISLAEN